MSAFPYDEKSREALLKLSFDLESSRELSETIDFTSYDTPAPEKCRYEHDYSAEQLRMIEAQLRKHSS